MVSARGWTLALLIGASLACSSLLGPRGFEPVRFDSAPRPPAAEELQNWSEPPVEAWKRMTFHTGQPASVERTTRGTSGAEKMTIAYATIDEQFTVKSKWVPEDLDGINNSPRRELAAYHAQDLFLDPVDYVAPPTSVRCLRIEVWKKHHGGEAKLQIPGSNCVLVVLSLWIEDVTLPAPLYDEQRFLVDPTYARYLADFNLFTYLIAHQDGREGNFLVSKNGAARQVFAVDNGVSFGAFFHNWFVVNWGTLRVAALREESVDRLRVLTRADLDAFLVIQQLEDDGSGMLKTSDPGPPIHADGGAHTRDGVVQFGLKRAEIDGMWKRVERLIEDVDGGKIPVF
jgi:hypothetical protein